jgi:hypothetical protein
LAVVAVPKATLSKRNRQPIRQTAPKLLSAPLPLPLLLAISFGVVFQAERKLKLPSIGFVPVTVRAVVVAGALSHSLKSPGSASIS